MKKETKIAVGIAGSVLLLCCCLLVFGTLVLPRFAGDFLEGAVVSDPEKATEIGQSILTYELPAGYAEEGFHEFLKPH